MLTGARIIKHNKHLCDCRFCITWWLCTYRPVRREDLRRCRWDEGDEMILETGMLYIVVLKEGNTNCTC